MFLWLLSEHPAYISGSRSDRKPWWDIEEYGANWRVSANWECDVGAVLESWMETWYKCQDPDSWNYNQER